ncbi:TetR/AcrR family transcriptional regulator [Pararhizobium sp. YC-54]|uniref:TetR/AcrR family transcriptional regulator n=1 Tax=Pararhizobium sp. YC-54 TaxID=2986920 RepID=UPI0021F7B279|nr:TetR/AcrR family transcriptional regulator [Pararhizobium sp. YC-54]MCV9997793.1 TetR/AcrR family transcriptional regulator [Pararhizobium sp. YC-54]
MMTSESRTARAAYHHGNLTEVLLAAAIALIEEKGVEALSVREVAKRSGVSPGAPFRHFSSKTALLTAVAEEAMGRLTAAVRAEMSRTGDADPIEALRAIGRGYLAWALSNPTHFQIISSRSLIDFHDSPRLVEENEAIRVIMVDLIARAQREGRLRPGIVPGDLVFSSRAFIYGVARMWIDGHFEEWRVERPVAEVMESALDLFIKMIDAQS